MTRRLIRLVKAGAFAAGLGLALGFSAGCDNLKYQARYDPLEPSDFFTDGNSARPLVAGAVARGDLRVDHAFYDGKVGSQPVDTLPVPLTRELLDRGRQRFDIFCAPCHGRTGEGNGMIVQRGFIQPPAYHIQRLREAPIGHFYDVMTNGFGAMYGYNYRIPPEDRWAIAAYIRVLQLSQGATLDDVPPAERQKLQGGLQ